MGCRYRHLITISILPLCVYWLSALGCGLDVPYLLPQISGQYDILVNSVSIEKALQNGDLTEEQAERMELLLDARSFARDTIGLETEDAYKLYFDTGDGPVAYNVSACVKHAFVPKTWTFPLVGTVPYLGYFNWPQAAQKVNELTAQGYDVLHYEVDAYSTLTFLPDPVFSGMLDRNPLSIVDTVCHELTHRTVWHPGNTTFNESLATWVGQTGAVQFFQERYPDQPETAQTAVDWYADMARYNEFIFSLYEDLQAFYEQDIPWQEKLAGREAVYQAARDRFVREILPQMNLPDSFTGVADLPTNNAWILANVRYNQNLDLFESVHEATGRNWPDTLDVFRAAANAGYPYDYIRGWLADQPDAATSPGDGPAPDADTEPAEPADESAAPIHDMGPGPQP
jgi:predicted aminopeptidase